MRDPLDIIQTVKITEKNTVLAEKHNQYVFRVIRSATKQEIKYAVKMIFEKEPIRVNTMRVTGKIKRGNKGKPTQRASYKKAIVTLKEGDKIDLV